MIGLGVALTLGRIAINAGEAQAEGEYYLRAWDTDDGLPYNAISHIVQDAQGFLWFATSGGLARYDGYQFKEIKLPQDYLSKGRNIRALIAEDPQTLLMLPTNGAVVRLRNGEFSLHPASSSVGDKQPADVFVEPSGALWLGMNDGTLMRWEQGQARWFNHTGGPEERVVRFTFATGVHGETWLANGSYLGRYHHGHLRRFEAGTTENMLITGGSNGRLWVCTPTQLRQLDNGHWQILSRDVPWKNSFASIQWQFEDRDGVFWIAAGRFGLYRFTAGSLSRVDAPTPTRFVTQDREGDLWVGSGGNGVALLRKKTYRLFDTRSSLDETVSNGVYIGAGDEIWLANNSGGVAHVQGEKVAPVHLSFGGRPLFLNTVHLDAVGNLWAGGQDGLYLTNPASPTEVRKLDIPERNVHLLFASRRGDMWFGADPGQLGYYRDGTPHVLTAEQGYEGQTVRAAAEDDEGRIWMGALNGDLLCFRDEHFIRFTTAQGLSGQPIHDLRIDKNGVLWIATADGLVLYEGDQFHQFTQADGLADDLILRVVEDNYGVLWFASRSGIYSVEKKELLALSHGTTTHVVSRRYGRDQGLTGVMPTANYQPSAGKSSNGTVWLSTSKGVVAITPPSPQADQPPPIFIDDVLIDNKSVGNHSGIELPPGKHRIEFQFAAPSFASDKIQINHQLENADPDWIETIDTRTAAYSGLQPGTYRMVARARSGSGEWSRLPASLSFVVRAAWWQHVWLQIGVAGLVTLGAAGAARQWTQRFLKQRLRRLEQVHALEVERSRIARNLHDELGASLTEIGLFAERLRHTAEAELPAALPRLITRIRRLHIELASIIWTVNPQNNSLDQFAAFLRKYATRLFRHSSTVCRIEGVETIPVQPISPDIQHHILAIAKEALNNVVTHAHAMQVVITTAFRAGCFHLEIQDDGVGFAADEVTDDHGNGLINMRARVAEIGGTFQLKSRPGEGTRIVISVPCNPAAANLSSSPTVSVSS